MRKNVCNWFIKLKFFFFLGPRTFFLLMGHSCPVLNCDKVRTSCCHRHLLPRGIITHLCLKELCPCRLLFFGIIRATLQNYSAGQKKKNNTKQNKKIRSFFCVVSWQQCSSALELNYRKTQNPVIFTGALSQQEETAALINTLILDRQFDIFTELQYLSTNFFVFQM